MKKRTRFYSRDRSLEGSQYTFAWKTVRNRTVSVQQAAEKMGCSEDTVRRMVKAHELIGVPMRVGVKNSPYRVSLQSVEDYCCKHLDAFGLDEDDVKDASSRQHEQLPPRR